MCHRWPPQERQKGIDPAINPGVEEAWTFSGCDQVVLDIDGTSVLLNAFVQKIIENIVLGIVTSLEGVKENPQRITLSVIRKDKEDDKL